MSKRQKMSKGRNKDVYPNYFSMEMVMSNANVLTTKRIALPIPRITTGTSATIMEFLWSNWTVDSLDMVAQGDTVIYACGIGPSPTASEAFEEKDGTVLFQGERMHHITTSGSIIMEWPVVCNWQTTDGHGVLVAADSMWMGLTTAGMAAASSLQLRVYYRFVTVSMTEYVGIVQSQVAN